MALDLKKLQEAIDNITPEEIEKYFPPDTRPKGWLSIEDYLPHCYAIDFVVKGYSEFKVKYADGHTDVSRVCDHGVWYYYAKEEGITHWLNE